MKRAFVCCLIVSFLFSLFSCTQPSAPHAQETPDADDLSLQTPVHPQNAEEVSIIAQDGYTYTARIENGKAILTSIRYGMYFSKESDEPLVLPSSIGGYPVTEIEGSLYRLRAKEVLLPETLENFPGFYRGSATTVFLPKNVKEVGQISYKCALSEVRVDEENLYFTAVDGILYDKKMTKLNGFPEAKSLDVYELPDTVTEIDSAAFGRVIRIGRFVIGEQVTNIGEGLLYGVTDYRDGFTLVVKEGSYAHTYFEEHLKDEVISDFAQEVCLEVVKA